MPVELGDRAFEAAFAACDLQALDEFAGAHEQHAPPVLDESKPKAAARYFLPAQVGRTSAKLAPFSSQLSPAASGVRCALQNLQG